MKLIKELIYMWYTKKFCCHDWKFYHETKTMPSSRNNTVPLKIEHTLICKKCGEIKRIEL